LENKVKYDKIVTGDQVEKDKKQKNQRKTSYFGR